MKYGDKNGQLPMKSCIVWAAFNADTGECMVPTIRSYRSGAVAERNRFYKGCPIYQCSILPLYADRAIRRSKGGDKKEKA